jgi:hypothetical protein
VLVISNTGEQLLLDASTGKVPPATPWTLRLFANNHDPAKDDLAANYTEAAGAGYAPIDLDASQLTTVPGSPTVTSYPQQQFTFTGAITVYGYYITDANGDEIFAEKLASPYSSPVSGGFVRVTPQVTLGSVSGD